jgi:EmrB/QacA subfamily drug resistance transporter
MPLQQNICEVERKPCQARETPPIRRVLVFTIVALALLMMSIDGTIIATALPALQRGLGTTVNWAGWTLTAYSFGFVIMLPLSGMLSGRFGRRRVFVGSVITFTAASLFCGLANNIFALIALRGLQAAGGAGFTPSATGIIVDYFGDKRDRAVSLFGSIFPIGAMIGPIFGGLFVTYWSWRGVFFVNLPIGAAILVLASRYIPRDPPLVRTEKTQMDFAGMCLLGVGLLTGMVAVSSLAGGAGPAFLVSLIVASVSFWLFFRHIGRTANPFVVPRLIFGSKFGPVNLTNSIYGGFTMGAMALLPVYAENRYGLGALNSGTLLVAQGIATILLSVATALALRRTGYRLPLCVGGVVIAAGMSLLALAPAFGFSPYAWLALSAFLVGVGAGTINPPSRIAGLQLAPEQSSTLAALRSLFLQVGSIVAISTATAILSISGNPGAVQAAMYASLAALLVVMLPLIAKIPEHHGSW